ncbi:MAG: NINE protein [Propionibacteriaceae bacterium]
MLARQDLEKTMTSYPQDGQQPDTGYAQPSYGQQSYQPYPPQQQSYGPTPGYDPYAQQQSYAAPQGGYTPQGGYAPQPMVQQGYYLAPHLGAVSDKSKTTALLLSFFLGAFGIDRFYLGYTGLGIVKLFFGWLTFGIWPLIDFILILMDKIPDSNGRPLAR